MAEGIDLAAGDLELEELPAEEPAEALEDTAAAALGESVEEDIFKLDEEAAPALEATGEGDEAADLDLLPELGLEEPQAEIEPEAEVESKPKQSRPTKRPPDSNWRSRRSPSRRRRRGPSPRRGAATCRRRAGAAPGRR